MNRPDTLPDLIAEWQGPIYNLAYRWLGNDADACDAVQEVFVRVIEQLPHYDDSREFKPWVYRVATNSIQNGLRSRKRRKARENAVARRRAEHRDEECDAVERAEREAVVDQLVSELPIDLRQLIALHYYSGLSQAEIAAALELPRSTVQARVERARCTLRDALQQSGHFALIPLFEQTMLRATPLPVPEALASSLSTLTHSVAATTAASVGGAVTQATIGGIVMNKQLALCLVVATTVSLGLGFTVGRVTGTESESQSTQEETADLQHVQENAKLSKEAESLRTANESLLERVAKLDQHNKQLVSALEVAQSATQASSTAQQVASEETTNDREDLDFQAFGDLLGENLELVARMALDDDRSLTAAEKRRVMSTQSALMNLVGKIGEISDDPLYDEKLYPRIVETLYGGALQLDSNVREEIHLAAQEVLAQHTEDVNLESATAVARYSNRMSMLEAISGAVHETIPEEGRARFARADGIARELMRGGRTEVQIGIGADSAEEEFHNRTHESWTEIYDLRADQEAEARRISKWLYDDCMNYIKQQRALDPSFDGSTATARQAYMELQNEAEESLLRQLNEDQRTASVQRNPAVFFLTPGDSIRVQRSGGVGF